MLLIVCSEKGIYLSRDEKRDCIFLCPEKDSAEWLELTEDQKEPCSALIDSKKIIFASLTHDDFAAYIYSPSYTIVCMSLTLNVRCVILCDEFLKKPAKKRAIEKLVEVRRIELLTSAMPLQRSPS